jgi:hypothetical protein
MADPDNDVLIEFEVRWWHVAMSIVIPMIVIGIYFLI